MKPKFALTAEQRTKAAEALDRLSTEPCASCRNEEFSVIELVEAVPYGMTMVVGSCPTIPVLLVQCNRCGLLLHFSATALGLVEPLREEGGPEKKP